jgi:hypothetical protein
MQIINYWPWYWTLLREMPSALISFHTDQSTEEFYNYIIHRFNIKTTWQSYTLQYHSCWRSDASPCNSPDAAVLQNLHSLMALKRDLEDWFFSNASPVMEMENSCGHILPKQCVLVTWAMQREDQGYGIQLTHMFYNCSLSNCWHEEIN